MKEKFLKFPEGFLWGASTSAHQVEGGNHNDWSEWEKKNAVRLASKSKKYPKDNYISGRSADHYSRYEKDFDIAKELGMNAQRISLEWSRIEPKEGKFNEKEIEHYAKVIVALRERGMEPFVTLHHFTNPVWFAESGGWLSKKAPEQFEKYARYVTEKLSDVVRYWITINEPGILALNAFMQGKWPPQKNSKILGNRALKIMIHSHRRAYRAMKKIKPDLRIGITKNNTYFEAYSKNLLNLIAVAFLNWKWNKWVLNKIRMHQDFVGVNYYFHNRVRVKGFNPEKWFNYNESKVLTDMGWEIYPEGIYKVVKQVSKYAKPIYITENGIADKEDTKRSAFIKEHLRWLHKAIEEGVDVRGYLHWSLMDNFEWAEGFWPRFGLIEINYENNLERKVRKSAKEYAKIIKENGLE